MKLNICLHFFCVLLLFVGCGPAEKEDASAGTAGEQNQRAESVAKPAEPVAQSDVPVAPDMPAATEPGAADAAESKPPAASPEETDFETAFAEVLELEKELKFSQALVLCRKLRREYRSPEATKRIGAKIVQLNNYATRAGQLRYAVNKLTDDAPAAQRYAKKQLLDAGELGRLLLRKAIRDRADMDTAVGAARTLTDADGQTWLPFFVEQLLPPPDEPLLGLLVDSILEYPGKLTIDILRKILEFQQLPAAQPYAEEISDYLRQAAAVGLTPEQLTQLYEMTTGDQDFSRRGLVHFLGLAYAFRTFRQPEDFNALFEQENVLRELRNYVERAANSPDPDVAAWAKRGEYMFAAMDFGLLRKGLVAWWGLDAIAQDGTSPGHSWNGRNLKMVGDNPMKTEEGITGKAVRFEKTDTWLQASAEDETLRKIQNGSYSFAAWVKADGIPDGQQPDPYWGIVYKQGWHLGLELRSSGKFQFVHFDTHRKSVVAASETRCEPGEWYHLVGTVDQEQGKVRIYVNGELEGEASFPPKSRAWDAFEEKPLRIGAAREVRYSYACRWQGLIDEVAIYQRAVDHRTVSEIHSLRGVRLRTGLAANPR